MASGQVIQGLYPLMLSGDIHPAHSLSVSMVDADALDPQKMKKILSRRTEEISVFSILK